MHPSRRSVSKLTLAMLVERIRITLTYLGLDKELTKWLVWPCSQKKKDSSQKHKTVGMQMLYSYFNAISICLQDHTHDRNTMVNKIFRAKSVPTDTHNRWHAAKMFKKGRAGNCCRNEEESWKNIACCAVAQVPNPSKPCALLSD